MITRKQHIKEFKLDAISLVLDQGYTTPVTLDPCRKVASHLVSIEIENIGIEQIDR